MADPHRAPADDGNTGQKHKAQLDRTQAAHGLCTRGSSSSGLSAGSGRSGSDCRLSGLC